MLEDHKTEQNAVQHNNCSSILPGLYWPQSLAQLRPVATASKMLRVSWRLNFTAKDVTWVALNHIHVVAWIHLGQVHHCCVSSKLWNTWLLEKRVSTVSLAPWVWKCIRDIGTKGRSRKVTCERSIEYSSDSSDEGESPSDNLLSYGNFHKSNCGTTSFD